MVDENMVSIDGLGDTDEPKRTGRRAKAVGGNSEPAFDPITDPSPDRFETGAIQTPNSSPSVTPAKGMPKTVRIMLEETDNMPPTGQPIGFNGRMFIIRPGEWVDVPQGVVNILEDAVMSVPIVDPQTKKVVGHRNRLRIPFRRG